MMETELEPRWSGSRANFLMHHVIVPLTHPDPIATFRVSLFPQEGPGWGEVHEVDSLETRSEVLALWFVPV